MEKLGTRHEIVQLSRKNVQIRRESEEKTVKHDILYILGSGWVPGAKKAQKAKKNHSLLEGVWVTLPTFYHHFFDVFLELLLEGLLAGFVPKRYRI